ncbi:hypothetical protein LTR66_005463 [Elasticomyces elasticus]|nr:hypothetical protein LTR66_005463 [Elasticomyces elasticus]
MDPVLTCIKGASSPTENLQYNIAEASPYKTITPPPKTTMLYASLLAAVALAAPSLAQQFRYVQVIAQSNVSGGPGGSSTNTSMSVPLNTTWTNTPSVTTLSLVAAYGVPLDSVTCMIYQSTDATGTPVRTFNSVTSAGLSTNTVTIGSLVCTSSTGLGSEIGTSSSSSIPTLVPTPASTMTMSGGSNMTVSAGSIVTTVSGGSTLTTVSAGSTITAVVGGSTMTVTGGAGAAATDNATRSGGVNSATLSASATASSHSNGAAGSVSLGALGGLVVAAVGFAMV